MSDKISNEIDQVADQMEKSTKTPKEILFDTIRQLGAEGIRAKLPTLEKGERELLVSVLTEMNKAVEMDDQYQAKFVQGKLKATIIQEDKADDDQDEKLVKPEAATLNHQGTPTDGWEGQVIKGKKDMSKEEAKDKIMEMEEKEHKTKDPKKLVEAEKEEHSEGKKDKDSKKKEKEDKKMSKAEDMDKCGEGMYKKQGVPKGVNPEKQERCVRKLKGEPGKNPYAICNASMKKGNEITTEVKEALLEIKKSIEEQLKEFGVEASPSLVKAEMKRLLQEEDQDGDAPEMNVPTRANKEKVEALDLGKDNDKAQKKVDDEKQGKDSMKKAVWGGENDLLRAMTGGRNHHFSLEEYFQEVLREAAKSAEEMQKSEKKEDLNDLIEKSQDASWDQVNCERMLKANNEKVKGRFSKSFEDNEIAEALGLSPEEAKKILGE